MNDDPDAAAILARRQRFIALALSSLAGLTTAACRPQACLSIAAPEDTAAPPEQPEQPDAPVEPTEATEQPEAPAQPTAPDATKPATPP